jgi:hypothetical protein
VAAVFCPGHLDGLEGTIPLPEVFALARGGGVPGIVDAAFLNYPPASMRRFVDLVCFSAKHYYGPSGAASSAAAAT